MTIPFQKGRYMARFADGRADVAACQRLRHLSFFGAPGVDADRFDHACRHLMVEDASGRLVAAVRLFQMATGAEALNGYAAQYYDLSPLAVVDAPMAEIGRFCVAPDVLDADVLRIAWGALTQLVDDTGVKMLFGCTSFAGIDVAPYGRAFNRLAERHVGSDCVLPGVKAIEVLHFAQIAVSGDRPMPSLLRTYLAMGGWVGDHVVIDRAMNTMHVFTCVEVDAVPSGRARALRALAQAPALP